MRVANFVEQRTHGEMALFSEGYCWYVNSDVLRVGGTKVLLDSLEKKSHSMSLSVRCSRSWANITRIQMTYLTWLCDLFSFGINANSDYAASWVLSHGVKHRTCSMTPIDLFCNFCREVHIFKFVVQLINRDFSLCNIAGVLPQTWDRPNKETSSTTRHNSNMSICQFTGRVRAYHSPRHLPNWTSVCVHIYMCSVAFKTRPGLTLVSVIFVKALPNRTSFASLRGIICSRNHACDCHQSIHKDDWTSRLYSRPKMTLTFWEEHVNEVYANWSFL